MGLWFGATSGEVFGSADAGATWHVAARDLARCSRSARADRARGAPAAVDLPPLRQALRDAEHVALVRADHGRRAAPRQAQAPGPALSRGLPGWPPGVGPRAAGPGPAAR